MRHLFLGLCGEVIGAGVLVLRLEGMAAIHTILGVYGADFEGRKRQGPQHLVFIGTCGTRHDIINLSQMRYQRRRNCFILVPATCDVFPLIVLSRNGKDGNLKHTFRGK